MHGRSKLLKMYEKINVIFEMSAKVMSFIQLSNKTQIKLAEVLWN